MIWNKTITFVPQNDWSATQPTTAEFFRVRSINPPRAGKFLLAQVEFNEFNVSLQDLQEIPATVDFINLRIPKSPIMDNRRIGIIQIEDYNSKDWAIELWESDYTSTSGNNGGDGGDGGTTPPAPTTIALTYQSLGDDNGLFYWLGSQGKTVTWENPAISAQCEITASGYLSNYARLSDLVNRDNSNFSTSYNQNSFVEFSLGTRKLKLNSYTIKTWNLGDGRHLRSWKLQGSNDGTTWTDVDSRTNDTSLTGINTWQAFAANGNTTDFFSYFQIILTGTDSTGDWYISMSEIELYGLLQP